MTAILLPITQLRAITGVIEALEVLDAHGTVTESSITVMFGEVQVVITCDEETADFAVELSTAVEELVEDEVPQPSAGALVVTTMPPRTSA